MGECVPQPYFVPGYTGHCPAYRHRIADTYGALTHKILMDPAVMHSEHLVLSDRTKDEFQVERPVQNDIDIVNGRYRVDYPIYRHPMKSGYTGFVPRLRGQLGQYFSVGVTEAMSQYEKCQAQQARARRQLMQAVRGQPQEYADNFVSKSQFKVPFFRVRPECAGILTELPLDEPMYNPPFHAAEPRFQTHDMPADNADDPCAGRVPSLVREGLKEARAPKTSKTYDLAANYKHRNKADWAPANIVK